MKKITFISLSVLVAVTMFFSCKKDLGFSMKMYDPDYRSKVVGTYTGTDSWYNSSNGLGTSTYGGGPATIVVKKDPASSDKIIVDNNSYVLKDDYSLETGYQNTVNGNFQFADKTKFTFSSHYSNIGGTHDFSFTGTK